MRRARSLVGLTLAVLLASASLARSEDQASLRGRVSIALPGTSLAALGPVVVYLESLDAPEPASSSPSVRITQSNAMFTPDFQVVAVGQPVVMANVDEIYHNVFSYSRPNDFDLGTYPAGESRTVRFAHPGVVKTYCSIHENMMATIVVVPTRHFDVVDRSGRFSLASVRPGRYRLRTWCEKVPDTSREITIEAGATLALELDLTPS